VTRFLDVRLSAVGGILAAEVAINQGIIINDYQGLDKEQLLSDIQGRHVLIGTHGFNVNRKDGIEALSNWERLLKLPPLSLFVGLLWPGDSMWAHGLDFPVEPVTANDAGDIIAPFLDANFGGAASISFVSHSLGARVVLRTVSKMGLPVRRVILMAGGVEDNCLNKEFKKAAAKVGEISALASRQDEVVSHLFPLGGFLAGIITEGHPWRRAALGLCGPSSPRPRNFRSPFQIPDNWKYNHDHYLQVTDFPPPSPKIPMPTTIPPKGAMVPVSGANGWQEAWSAAFCSTRFA
jgi:pimeloyl-ACP methyl ester carboxylesterase